MCAVPTLQRGVPNVLGSRRKDLTVPATVQRIPDHLLPHLTPQEAATYQLLLARELALASPLDLACRLRDDTQRWPHVEYINDHLVALVEYRLYPTGPGPAANWFYVKDSVEYAVDGPDDIPNDAEDFYGRHPEDNSARVVFRLAIAAPPRHGKSYIVTETFPLWYWMKYPDRNIALATYSDDFAGDWGVKIRDMLCDNETLLGLQLVNGKRSAAAHLRLTGKSLHERGEMVKANGEMFLVGSRGGLTGKGFQLGIIDDPFKDAQDAESQAERNARANWYTSVFSTRKTRITGKGIPVEVMMFTRWHIDDIAGRFVYDTHGDPRPDWCVIRLPALAEDDDPLGRALGAALCPAVKTRAELLELQANDPYWFASLYQGSPTVRKGNVIPPSRRYYVQTLDGDAVYQVMAVPDEDLPSYPGSEALAERLRSSFLIPAKRCTRFATVDLAASTKSYADWSVFSVWDWDTESQTLVLVGVVRERIESSQHLEWLKRCYAAFPDIVFVGVERKTYGLTLLQAALADRTVPVRPLDADTDKVSRAAPYAQAIGLGQVVIPATGEWVPGWMAEHASFPAGRHDDMVDTGAYAWSVVRLMPKRRAATAEPLSLSERIHAYVDKRHQKGRNRDGVHRLMT